VYNSLGSRDGLEDDWLLSYDNDFDLNTEEEAKATHTVLTA
jgi:hypothetical protein